MNIEPVVTGRFSSSEHNHSVDPSHRELTKKEAFKMLRGFTSKMKVPSHNLEKAQWLSKNLATRNSDHPDFEKAMALVNLILERGWS